jgi:HEAT repeat protein
MKKPRFAHDKKAVLRTFIRFVCVINHGSMGHIQELVEEMSAADVTVKRYAAIMLCRAIEQAQGAERDDVAKYALMPLAGLLSDPDPNIRSDAITSLWAAHKAGVRVDAAVPAMAKAAGDDTFHYVRLFAIKAIGSFVERMPELAPILLKAVRDEYSVSANSALAPLERFIRGCNDRKTLEAMRAELNQPRDVRRLSRKSCIGSLCELGGGKERRAMRRAINARLGDLRETDQVKKARTLLAMRICELDYPKLTLRGRVAAKVGNFGRRLKLSAAL